MIYSTPGGQPIRDEKGRPIETTASVLHEVRAMDDYAIIDALNHSSNPHPLIRAVALQERPGIVFNGSLHMWQSIDEYTECMPAAPERVYHQLVDQLFSPGVLR